METRYFSKVVYWIFFLSLVIVAIFFVHDVCQNYQERATSIQVTSKITQLLESPTLTLCFNPGFKASVLQKYNIDPNYFAGKIHQVNTNLSWPELINELSYNIGIDFNVSLSYPYGKMNGTYNIFDKNLKKSYSDKIESEEIYTIYNHGLCYRITPKIASRKWEPAYLNVKFDPTLPIEDIPKIELIFTSKENSYGIIESNWMDGNEYSIMIDPKKNANYLVSLTITQHLDLEFTSKCSNRQSYLKCVSGYVSFISCYVHTNTFCINASST